MTATEREARPGERCTCGAPATIVFITDNFGDVPYCGVPVGGADWPWPNTRAHQPDDER